MLNIRLAALALASIYVLAGVSALHAQLATQYEYIPIAGNTAFPFAVNNRGDVVGDALSNNYIRGTGEAPFLYRYGTFTTLGTEFAVVGISEDGVVGGTDYALPEWGVGLWQDGAYTAIPVGWFPEFWGMTAGGTLLGSDQGTWGAAPYYYTIGVGGTVLPEPGCASCGAEAWLVGGNDDGLMVGYGDDGTHVGVRPVSYSGGSHAWLPYTASGAPTEPRGVAIAVNDAGVSVGHLGQRWVPSIDDYAVAWIDGAVKVLSESPGSYAWDIADSGALPDDDFGLGVIVGESGGRATMWVASCDDSSGDCAGADPGSHLQMYDLNDLVVSSDGAGKAAPDVLIAAYGINDCGVIVGEGATSGFMLVPVASNDTDGDGLYDTWEICGIDANGDGSIDLVLPGADPRHKDIYVELDAMDAYVPSLEALALVVSAFAQAPVDNPDGSQGIRLHFVGEDNSGSGPSVCDPCIDDTDITTYPFVGYGGHWLEFQALKNSRFGSASERSEDNPNRDAILEAKALAYRYGISIQSYIANDNVANYSGLGEIPGNDFFIAMSAMDKPNDPLTMQKYAGTIMHELGHTLGLLHGGEDDTNFKPNHFSVMNYLWQVPVSPVILNNFSEAALQSWSQSWAPTYSDGSRPSLEENNLHEASGIGGTAPGWVPVGTNFSTANGLPRLAQMGPFAVDWDTDGSATGTSVWQNINYFPGASHPSEELTLSTLADADEWSLIQYLPNSHVNWSSEGGTSTLLRESTIAAGMLEFSADMYDSLRSMRFDCNGNDMPDDLELLAGTLIDANENGIPDSCEEAPSTTATPPGSPSFKDSRITVAPNPFNPSTGIRFELDEPCAVDIRIYDVQGRVVRRLFNGMMPSGLQEIGWDGRTDDGVRLASGMYFVRVQHGTRIDLVKAQLVK